MNKLYIITLYNFNINRRVRYAVTIDTSEFEQAAVSKVSSESGLDLEALEGFKIDSIVFLCLTRNEVCKEI